MAISSEDARDHSNDVEQEESYLFKEKDQVLRLMDGLVPESKLNGSNNHQFYERAKSSLEAIRSTLDKYLECPTLLDPSLKIMVDKLVSQVKSQLTSSDNDENSSSNKNNTIIRYPLTAIYALAKVRGYKCVNRFLSHNVEDVDLIWNALLSWKEEHRIATESDSIFGWWEPSYVLWHWMGVLSLVPFHSQVISGEQRLVENIIGAAKQDLEKHTGPVQEAASTCLASWLSRPDVDLVGFSTWAVQVIRDDRTETKPNNQQMNLVLGVLQVVTKILKHATASRKLVLDRLVDPLWEPILQLAEEPSTSNHLLLRRYLVKWWTRTSCSYFPPTRAPWRYQRGQRVLLMDHLQKSKSKETTTARETTATNNQKVGNASSSLNPNYDESFNANVDDLFFVPDQVEDAMGRILESLGHSSTVVRWSAAKGIGRVTERLPAPCALDVLEAVLEYFESPEKDHCWHGACLALAELARKGLLLPQSLHEVVHEIIKAVHYDVKRGHSSVGSNVRDAACYVFWAFARSYSPTVLRPHLGKLAEAVILTSLFDREVNCRRAASAAFQEAVGRQGMGSFPNGIYVVTTTDFFSLGNRTEAYITIAPKIAQLEEYRRPIMEHIYKEKLFHWDPAIRLLASKALAAVAPLDTRLIGQTAIPFLLEKSLDSKNLHVRHGAVLGVAEFARVLGEECNVLQTCMSKQTQESMLDLVNQIEKRRLYRGRGGEIMRAAVCRLVECISLSRIALDVKKQVGMLDAVDAIIPHPNEDIQQCACSALERLLTVYFPVGEKGPSDRLRTRVVEKFVNQLNTSKNPGVTRGYALALGCLPAKLLAPTDVSIDSVIKTLSNAANPKARVDGEGDAETRRNAVNSLARIVKTITCGSEKVETRKYPVQLLSENQCAQVINSLFLSMEDYNVDRRGDVGSWCRMAAMDGLTSLVLLCNDVPQTVRPIFAALSGTKLVGGLIKQLSEKLDGVRLHAGCCLQKLLLRKDNAYPPIVGDRDLVTSLELEDCNIDYKWAEAKSVFRRVMKAAMIQDPDSDEALPCPYYEHAISGIITSVGGKSESIHATLALLDHAKEIKGTQTQAQLGSILLGLFERHAGIGRVTLPLLRSVEKLLTRGCLDELLSESAEFATPFMLCIVSELRGCRDVHRLFALADVSAALMNALPKQCPAKRECLHFMCLMLGHDYPRVRSHVAEILYLAIEENPDALTSMCYAATTQLLKTSWGTDLTKEEVQQFTKDVQQRLGFTDEQSSPSFQITTPTS